VVAKENTSRLQVPAPAMRSLMSNPAVSALFLARMAGRPGRTSLNELARFAGVHQQDARELSSQPVEG
jgi:hypothetical protein